ncbi:TetR/AcrR family transcriptional regulator [Amycolatopsis sp. CA-128772]|uniref:TetR/AcrR family transcriptional regulator n=1 Tax=Amycolatopsis sp. CA-128772 TaxID=2073159 RepID=UPI000CD226C5|nr:TetR/AcrR family transcriptional regulator [Amycolatopsis sp. CA-128772]
MAGGGLRRVPRQARSREKLAKILAAADRLLAEDGVEALTTTRVAAEAGVSVGALYQYLPDRDAITEALAGLYLGRLETLMESFAEQAAGETWADPVGLLVDAFAGLYRAEPGFRALWSGRGLTDGTREADRAHKRVMATGVHRVLVAQRLLRDDYEAAVACRTAFLAADAVIQEVFRGDGAPELLEPVKTMLRAYLAHLPRP